VSLSQEQNAQDEERIDGACDTEKLRGSSTDVFCALDAHVMPDGRVSLVLYHPESFEMVALTTAIDNRGGATNAGCVNPLLKTMFSMRRREWGRIMA
jgi:hypothetical protein